jgi:hypothetical protein
MTNATARHGIVVESISMPSDFPQSATRLWSRRYLRTAAAAVLALCLLPQQANAYSVMTHEEVVDMAWLPHMVPLLKARFPSMTDDQIREAHAFAYGGCVLQDLGYYPKGSKFFSDLTHYVRSGDFVQALLDDASTPDELAFALGALAHYTSDEVGHPTVNIVTGQEFPKLQQKYGKVVTYEDGPAHHLRTEFGFDVVGVSRGTYAQEDYRNFIGFEVAKPLLERAFEETYGLKLKDIVHDEDASIGSTRWAVRSLIPKVTKIALLSYHDNIEHADPGFDRNKFRYRMNRTEYEKSWGKTYKKPGLGSRFLAVIIAILPKVGPLKALQLKLPNGDQQTLYIKSVNDTVDRLDHRLDKMLATAVPTAIPVADSNGKTPDADETKSTPGQMSTATGSTAQDAPLKLTSVDLDTGQSTAPGEYRLADETYADLAEALTRHPIPVSEPLRQNLLAYFAPQNDAANRLAAKPKQWNKVQQAVAKLRSAPAPGNATPSD